MLENGGVVRSVENAGTDVLPYTMKARRIKYQTGRYAFMEVDMGSVLFLFASSALPQWNIRDYIILIKSTETLRCARPRAQPSAACKRQLASLGLRQAALAGTKHRDY